MSGSTPDRRPPPWWSTVGALALLAFALGMAAVHNDRAAARPTGSDAAFSATAARAVLERVYPDATPHPIGSPANAAVRDRIVAELEALGAAPTIQRTVSCRGPVCGVVDNIVAVVRGRHPSPAVLLAVHYDSVPAGPGIGDDGSGVGIALEITRALQAGDSPAHDVIILIDDGEEAALLGAQAFVDAHPRAADVAVVVNAEARGTQGVSRLFETKGRSGPIIDAYLERAPDPNVSSLATAIYERMPNDTDLTVFGEAGMAGLNFAFVGGGARYHTPRDDLAHLSPGSLQHQGQEVLAAARALADLDLGAGALDGPDEVFETIAGFVVRWRRGASIPIAGALFVFVLVLGVGLRRRGVVTGRGAMRAGLGTTVLVVLVPAIVTGYGATASSLAPYPLRFVADPTALRVAWWLSWAGVTVGVAAVLARRCSVAEVLLSTAVLTSAVAVLVAIVLPGAAIVAAVPALAAELGLCLVIAGRSSGFTLAGPIVAAAGPLILFAQMALGLEDTFGVAMPGLLGGTLALAGPGTLPIAVAAIGSQSRRAIWGGVGAVAAGLAITAWTARAPAYDVDHPYPVDVLRVRDRRTGDASLHVVSFQGRPPAAMTDVGVEDTPTGLPWWRGPVYAGPASDADVDVAGLTFQDVRVRSGGARRVVEATVRSGRGSSRGRIYLPSEVTGVRVGDRPVALGRGVFAEHGDTTTWGVLYLRGLPAEGLALSFEAPGDAPVPVRTLDIAFDLYPADPPDDALRRLLEARPTWAGPMQMGDVDLVVDAHRL